MGDDPRRAYLAKHGVEAAVTAAITKALEKQPADPVSEVGRCLLDATHVVPAGAAMVPVLDYVSAHNVKGAVSAAIKEVASAMPADPIVAIGRKLAAGGAAPVSEFMAYWTPSTFAASALPTEKAYNESLKMPLGKRMMAEREARGIADPAAPKSEYMAYWAPAAYADSALPNKKAFNESLKLPLGQRCMLERAARGYAALDVTVEPPRSEFELYWAPRDFKDSALPTEKLFMESLKLPLGSRMVLEREYRGVKDPAVQPRSEFEAYWAPTSFTDSALTSEKDFNASLALPFGQRMMAEREARGMLDPGAPKSEYMAYWAPLTHKDSALVDKKAFEASKALPWGQRCAMERAARGYEAFDTAPVPRSEFLEYWAPTTFSQSKLKSEAEFAASLKLPAGARCMMERAAMAAAPVVGGMAA